MEQAVNMFTGGMVLDSHPLVQSSDTLSDALNATYITMNGNEVVLQNDMGNRRVDNAFLPAGYEPVGIKEHGGIIYIAAYNPITHRSQIGSFPSPERNRGTEYEDNGTEFNLTDFISANNTITTNEGITFLKNDILLYPLTKDTSLHAGDKFTVYSGEVQNWGNNGLLTNFGTEDGNEIYKYNKTPFNSYFTLSLGVMNSQNEFSDITSSLERFDSTGNIIKGLDSDEDKFNTGYFIAPENWKTVNNGLTGNDSALSNERGKIGANTYAYKLTGPLYLKAEVNHIQTFSYNMDISKILPTPGNNQITINIYITGTATYNCPDSGTYFDSFKFLYKPLNNNPYGNYITAIDSTPTNIETRIYDQVTGLYTSTITKEYTLSISNEYANSNLNYLIAVPLFHSGTNPVLNQNESRIYISNLSEAGSLEISKIGTNYCELDSWRYKNIISDNEIKTTIIDYRFDCYTDSNTEYTLDSIILTNQTTSIQEDINLGDIVSLQSKITNGRQELLIDWSKVTGNKINFQDLYLVTITFSKNNLRSPEIRQRFILGTELFNLCYSEINEEDFVSDFGIFMGELSENTTLTQKEIDIRNKYLNLGDNIEIYDPVLTDMDTQPPVEQGASPISKTQPQGNNYSCKSFSKTIDIEYNSNWNILNKELYPKDLTLSGTNTTVNITEISKEVDAQLVYSSNFSAQSQNFVEGTNDGKPIISIPIPSISTITNQSNHLRYNIILNDKIYYNYINETRLIGKGYVNVCSNQYMDKIIDSISANQKYNGYSIRLEDWSGQDYPPVGMMCINRNRLTYRGIDAEGWHWKGYWGTIFENFWTSETIYDDGNADMSQMYDSYLLPALESMGCPFTFMLFDGTPLSYFSNSSNFSQSDEWLHISNSATSYGTHRYCRVWWVNEDNKPIILNGRENWNWKGLFDSGDGDDDIKLNNIYQNILQFIGKTYRNNNIEHDLVMPLENFYLNAWYPNSNSYLYSDSTKIDLNTKINYILNSSNVQTYSNGCLNFKATFDNSTKTIERILTKKYTLDNSFSQNIFNVAQQSDLSNFSVDLETGNILSKNDPLKHLYIRNKNNQNQLKEVTRDYPIQINTGTKYDFPLTCKKSYDGSNIGNSVQYIKPAGENGTRLRAAGYWIPNSRRIPVLLQNDLTIRSDFFNT